ncbi:MAG: ribonuclease J [Desulfomonile tiedjei]|uniref:Ribonuclease J n=1 Tax=Desulfomonile tiedjei TaxID=2358 RepID=A0A9D6V6R8_9BACT|nr:ribonuclease J [Desulfomonile tiedjei]
MTDINDAPLRILPLGGLGEIGLNMMAVLYEQDAFIIDAGLMFPDESMPGVDIVIPDVDVLLTRNLNIHGIVLTHGHEDHIGALPYVLKKIPVPIYATGFTMGLIESKLEEFNLLDTTDRHLISTEQPIDLGPFAIDFFAMCHSVADGVGLAVTTPAGVIIHSGDFKLDPTPVDGRLCDLEKIAAYARGGRILALLSDSTNVERKGITPSESAIRPAFEKIFREARGRILIATFSSHVHRIQQIVDLAREFDRKIVILGRSMASNVKLASEKGYLDVPQGILQDVKDLDSLPDEGVAVLSTGSQGEPMSAISLMAFDKHKYLRVKPGDIMVLSSRFIPGNEKAINHVINEFCRRGARVIYDKISDVHVSGHAGEEELRYLIRLARPQCFVPIHGEYRQLQRHAQIALEEGMPPENVLIAQDGDIVEFSERGATILEQVEAGRTFVHGKGVGDIGHNVLRDRRLLAEVGIVTVVIVVDRESCRRVSGPEFFSKGLTFEEVEPELFEGALHAVEEQLAVLDPTSLDQWENSKEDIRLAVRRHINRTLGRKPLVQTIIMQV